MFATAVGRLRPILAAGAVVAFALVGTGCEKLKARDHLNQGVNAFRAGNYAAAADEFRTAIETDPTLLDARLYLATAYEQQFVPGTETEQNKKFADAAMSEFQKVLQDSPKSLLATQSIASLFYNMKDFEKAREWNKKVIGIDDKNKEAYYTLGVLAWTDFLPVDREARNNSHMKPEDPGPIKDAKIKAELKAKYWDSLTEGIEFEKKALGVDPQYEDAMSYMNLLIRYRADLQDSHDQYVLDVKEADDWIQKSLEAKKQKADKKAAANGGGTVEAQ